MKNSAGQGECYPPRPKAEVDNTLRDLQNSAYPTKANSVIALLFIQNIFFAQTCKLYSQQFFYLLNDTNLCPGFLGQWFKNLWRQLFNNLQRAALLTEIKWTTSRGDPEHSGRKKPKLNGSFRLTSDRNFWNLWHNGKPSLSSCVGVLPCIRLARGKFELTNQESASGKNSSVLTSSWNQATFVTGDGVKYPRKGIYNFKNHTRWQKVKNMNQFVFLSFYLVPKMGHRRSACLLAISSSSIAR